MRVTRGSRRPGGGRFLLRLAPGLHAALRAQAGAAGLSLNEYCVRRLAAPAGALAETGEGAAAVTRAASLVGAGLVGVAVFGSWARGEAAAGSDVDLLVVVDEAVALTRDLYRRWDEAPLAWSGRAVDAHFAHLPPPDQRVAGLWGEVALDGIVLFEQGLRLSRRLATVRRDIGDRRIVRRVVHGQPYWTLVA